MKLEANFTVIELRGTLSFSDIQKSLQRLDLRAAWGEVRAMRDLSALSRRGVAHRPLHSRRPRA